MQNKLQAKLQSQSNKKHIRPKIRKRGVKILELESVSSCSKVQSAAENCSKVKHEGDQTGNAHVSTKTKTMNPSKNGKSKAAPKSTRPQLWAKQAHMGIVENFNSRETVDRKSNNKGISSLKEVNVAKVAHTLVNSITEHSTAEVGPPSRVFHTGKNLRSHFAKTFILCHGCR